MKYLVVVKNLLDKKVLVEQDKVVLEQCNIDMVVWHLAQLQDLILSNLIVKLEDLHLNLV